MATATPKKKLNLSVEVEATDVTIKDITDAQSFVGAPNSARINIANVGPSYKEDGAVDENSNPYRVTFSWSEER